MNGGARTDGDEIDGGEGQGCMAAVGARTFVVFSHYVLLGTLRARERQGYRGTRMSLTRAHDVVGDAVNLGSKIVEEVVRQLRHGLL